MIFTLNLELKPQPCDSSPCKNDGICTNQGTSFSCECKCGYRGKTCEGIVSIVYDLVISMDYEVIVDEDEAQINFHFIEIGENE